MILSVSRRTDIPAFYSNWFFNRLRAGFVLVKNPRNSLQISKIPLSPQVVDSIVFWTKDPQNMIDKLGELDNAGYRYYFQFTLNPYDRTIEQNLRDRKERIATFIRLSEMLGKYRVLWRYDPIILNDTFTIAYHREQFTRLCEALWKYTDQVTISFVDLYAKCRTSQIRPIEAEEMEEMASCIGQTAKDYHLLAKACCEETNLSRWGVTRGSCIDKHLIERLMGCEINLPYDKNQREGCICRESIDIGLYDTCPGGCVYCYAGRASAGMRNFRCHDPHALLLAGELTGREIIRERNTVSCRSMQMKLT